MSVDRQSLGKEELIARTHHATIIQIDIVDEEPSTDTVGLERTALLDELHVILIEEQARLILRIGSHIVG